MKATQKARPTLRERLLFSYGTARIFELCPEDPIHLTTKAGSPFEKLLLEHA
jgi:hypothetical protein